MTRDVVLTPDELAAVDLPLWTVSSSGLERTVHAPTFLAGVELVSQAARVMEEMDHHADVDIRWRDVKFFLVNHDAGGVTILDVEQAHRIDALASW